LMQLINNDCLYELSLIKSESVDLHRNFIGIEIDENYFNIAKERIGE